jgi:DNA topoisomerase-1
MRTDSLRIAPEFITATKGHIIETMGAEYSKPRAYKDKKGAQAAHETIRPTGLARTPEFVTSHLDRDAKRCYDMIYRRYLASQMADSTYERRILELEHEGFVFRIRSLKQVFDGFEKMYLREKRETDFQLPEFTKGDGARLLKLVVESKQTQPPSRFTEASLIRRLEANGIGRPSTYASIMATLSGRHYVTRERATMIPTELGILVNDLLIPRFGDLFNVEFTRKMEEELDQVAEGSYDWQKILREFWEPFSVILKKVEAEIPAIKQEITKDTGEVCPKCGQPLMEKWGRFGKFLACSGFPDCRYTKPLGEEQEEKTERKCPECEAQMVIKVGRFGRFLACSRYPECKHTSPYVLPQPCPLCGSDVLELRGKRGKFYKCSAEGCIFTSPYPLSDELCEKCNAYMVAAPKETYCVKCNPERLSKPRNKTGKKSSKKKT